MPSRRRPAAPLSLQGALWLSGRDGELGGLGRMALLRAVQEHGSITAAAKAVGMSYKAAWDAIDTMNRHAGTALVQRQAGGRGGGATTLTPHGLRLLQRYGEVAAAHQRFVQQIGRHTMDLDRPFSLLDVLNVKTSARNSLAATVTALQPGAVNDEVHLALGHGSARVEGGALVDGSSRIAGSTLVATVSAGSTRALALAPGVAVVAMVQASAVMLSTGAARLSARNALRATVQQVKPGAVNAEVSLTLPGGGALQAMVPISAVGELGLSPGQPVTAWIQASDVVLAVIA